MRSAGSRRRRFDPSQKNQRATLSQRDSSSGFTAGALPLTTVCITLRSRVMSVTPARCSSSWQLGQWKGRLPKSVSPKHGGWKQAAHPQHCRESAQKVRWPQTSQGLSWPHVPLVERIITPCSGAVSPGAWGVLAWKMVVVVVAAAGPASPACWCSPTVPPRRPPFPPPPLPYQPRPPGSPPVLPLPVN